MELSITACLTLGVGRSDFDFGTWQRSEQKAYGFDIRHFGAEGMKYLGGENLLELLAFKVFEEKENCAQLLEKQIAIVAPYYEGITALLRGLLDISCKRNLQDVAEYLRAFVEGLQEERLEDGEEEEELKKISLLDKNGKRHVLDLKIGYAKLLSTLKEEIISHSPLVKTLF